MDVNDIFFTENWAGQELLHLTFFAWMYIHASNYKGLYGIFYKILMEVVKSKNSQ